MNKNIKIKKSMLHDVNEFINNHYEFRCNPEYKGILGKIKAFFDRIDAEKENRINGVEYYYKPLILYSGPVSDEKIKRDIEESIEESFSPTLMRLINQKGKSYVDTYKRANIDRRVFSKIRTLKDYIPSKRTAIAFAIVLELPLDEANELLRTAGYTLSSSILFDVIITYFIKKGEYDIFAINETLFAYNQPLLVE